MLPLQGGHGFGPRATSEARADVFDYIEQFANLRRRHSTLQYLKPGGA